jgi:hypothetical protein
MKKTNLKSDCCGKPAIETVDGRYFCGGIEGCGRYCKTTHKTRKSTHNLGNLPKTKELKRHICRFNDGKQSCDCFIKGQKAENKAWLKGERCHSCGKYMEPQRMTNICPTCWENN